MILDSTVQLPTVRTQMLIRFWAEAGMQRLMVNLQTPQRAGALLGQPPGGPELPWATGPAVWHVTQRLQAVVVSLGKEGVLPCTGRKKESVSCSVMSDSLQPHGLEPTRLLCP